MSIKRNKQLFSKEKALLGKDHLNILLLSVNFIEGYNPNEMLSYIVLNTISVQDLLDDWYKLMQNRNDYPTRTFDIIDREYSYESLVPYMRILNAITDLDLFELNDSLGVLKRLGYDTNDLMTIIQTLKTTYRGDIGYMLQKANEGNLKMEEDTSYKPVNKKPVKKEPVKKEPEVRLEEEVENPNVMTSELQEFFEKNGREINLNNTVIVLDGKRYKRPSDLNDILHSEGILLLDKQIVLNNDKIDIHDNVLRMIFNYEQLLGIQEHPMIYLMVMIVEQKQLKNFISSMKNMIQEGRLRQAQQENNKILNEKVETEKIISGLQQENAKLKSQINATVESGKMNEQQILAQMNQLKNIAQQNEFYMALTAAKNELDMVLKMDTNDIMQYLSIVDVFNEKIHYKSRIAEAELSLRDILGNQVWYDIFSSYTQFFIMLYNTPISPMVLLLKLLRAENNPRRIEAVRNQIESLLRERFTRPDNIGIFVQQNNRAKDVAMDEEQESEFMKQLRQFIKQHENEKNDIELTETIYDITNEEVQGVLNIVKNKGIALYQGEYGNILYDGIMGKIPIVLQNYNTLREYFTLVLKQQMNPVLVFDAALTYSNRQGNLDALLNTIIERIKANKQGEKMSMSGNTYNINLAKEEVYKNTNEVIEVLQEGGIQIITFYPKAYFTYNSKAIPMQNVMSEQEYNNMMKFLKEQMHVGEVALHTIILSYIYTGAKKYKTAQIGYDEFIKYLKGLIEKSKITVKEVEEERKKKRGDEDEMADDLDKIDKGEEYDEDIDIEEKEEEEKEEEPKREGGMKPVTGFTKNSFGGN